jgi:cobalt-zinc-cadmium resistance protein CzcA
MQYQVLLDPNKLFAYGVTVPQISQQLATTTPTPAAASIPRAASSTTSAAWAWCATRQDIGNIVVQQKGGIPVYVKDVAKVEIGYAPRLGQFGYMKQDEAVEGVILMRVGEQAQVILKRVEAMTKDLNEHVLPPDVKVVPYYDRQA